MHNYTINVTRNSEEEFVYFPYSFEAVIGLPAAEVWLEWHRTHTDHDKCWLWPLKFSQPSVDPLPPAKGGIQTLTYQVPNPHDPDKLPHDAQYQFHIVEWDDDAMFYQYRAADTHPFLIGGGQMAITALTDDSCRFHQHGEYKYDANDPHAQRQGDVFAFYLCTFFTTMAQNIKNHVGF